MSFNKAKIASWCKSICSILDENIISYIDFKGDDFDIRAWSADHISNWRKMIYNNYWMEIINLNHKRKNVKQLQMIDGSKKIALRA